MHKQHRICIKSTSIIGLSVARTAARPGTTSDGDRAPRSRAGQAAADGPRQPAAAVHGRGRGCRPPDAADLRGRTLAAAASCRRPPQAAAAGSCPVPPPAAGADRLRRRQPTAAAGAEQRRQPAAAAEVAVRSRCGNRCPDAAAGSRQQTAIVAAIQAAGPQLPSVLLSAAAAD